MFDDQPLEFVKASAKSQSAYFSAMTPREFNQFTANARPVLSWHVTEIRDRDGKEMGNADRMTPAQEDIEVDASIQVPINADVNRQAAAPGFIRTRART